MCIRDSIYSPPNKIPQYPDIPAYCGYFDNYPAFCIPNLLDDPILHIVPPTCLLYTSYIFRNILYTNRIPFYTIVCFFHSYSPSHVSVSYTHLDVYKRQDLLSIKLHRCGGKHSYIFQTFHMCQICLLYTSPGHCTCFFILHHHIVLYLFSDLPFIMICRFLNPEFS